MFTLILALATCSADAVACDFVIRGAELFDGTGTEGRVCDIAVRGDRIVAAGVFEAHGTPRVLDATGLVAAPGFIDLHNHSDRPITQPETRANVNYLLQGATTIVTGNCGGGHVNVSDYLEGIDRHGAGTNVAHLVPQGSLRREVMGAAARPPSDSELAGMKRLVERGMKDGAWGMSTGLIYVPSTYATTDELVELAKVVAAHGGIYATHMRNENTQLLESVAEALEIGRRSGAAVHISHFKASGPQAWGLAADAVALVREARDRGQAVTADQYPYAASSTSLSAMVIPEKYRDYERLAAALAHTSEAPRVRDEIGRKLAQRGGGGRLFVANFRPNRTWQGKSLAEIAAQEGKPELEIVLHIQQHGGASMVNFGMSEEEVRLIMQQPFVATASDGSAKDIKAETVPHPRSYGCFPRKIGRYAIAGKTVSPAYAIRSASGLPADILKLPQRGYLRPGYFADIVVFDPKTFRDTATFADPHQYATGVRYLFVNGSLVVDEGKFTGRLAGRALRKVPPATFDR